MSYAPKIVQMTLKYLTIFFAILFLGTAADVPVMFLGVQGIISLYFVFIVGFLTDIFSDFFWYWLGQKIGVKRFERIKFFKVKPERMEMVSLALNKYGILMLYCSKFIYSLGVPTQIVAGAHRYSKKKFLLANSLGGMSVLLILYVAAKISPSVELAQSHTRNMYLNMLIFILIIGIFSVLLSKFLKRFFNRRASDRGPLP